MKKIIAATVLVIIIAIVGGVYYVLTNLDAIVKSAIEHYGSEATQTTVRVDTVKIQLSDGTGSIRGLTIANPAGYASPLAFSLGEIKVGINLQSLQQEPYIIDEITVLAPQVFVDINKDHKTNLNQIKNNLGKGVQAADSADANSKEASTNTATEPRLIIRRVRFVDGTITARVESLNNKEYELKLPAFDMANLGGKEGATPTQLAHEIIKRLTDTASEHVKKKIIDEKLSDIKARAMDKVDSKINEKFKAMFNK